MHPSAIDFKALWESCPSLFIACAPDDNFTVIAATEYYCRSLNRTRDQLVGKPLFATFPDSDNGSNKTIVDALRKAAADKTPQALSDTFRFDIMQPGQDNGEEFQERYWQTIECPVFNNCHEVVALLHACRDVTDFVKLSDKGEQKQQLLQKLYSLNEEMASKLYAAEAKRKEIEETSKASLALALAHEAKKTQFIGRLCHELRNPLSGFLGNVELLSDTLAEAKALLESYKARADANHDAVLQLLDKASTLSKHALDCAAHQGNILNECLDISKIDAGKLELDESPCDLLGLVRTAVNMMSGKAEAKGLQLLANLLDTDVFIKTDGYRLRQVLLNLLDNAIKYTDVGSVNLTLQVHSPNSTYTDIVITIRDTGVGISEEDLPRLFQRFTQVGSSAKRQNGTGLGLVISKDLIHLMGGELLVRSQRGQGTSFVISLKCLNVSESEKQELLRARCNPNESTPNPKEAPPAGDTPFRVLIAEDNPFNQMVLVNMLQSVNLPVAVAGNGCEALEALKKEQFDVILMDIQMPVMNGLEATEKIREHEKLMGLAPIPIIGLSANAQQSDKDLAVSSGMDDYLVKPCVKNLLLTTLFRWVQSRSSPAADTNQQSVNEGA